MKYTKKDTREIFDRSAESYAGLYDSPTRVAHFLNARKRRILELVSHTNPGRMLEVGCGPGILVNDLVSLGFDYVGVDVSPVVVRRCRQLYDNFPSVEFKVEDVQNLTFAESEFDAVLCIGALEYLENEATAWVEIRRVLRRGGLAIISGINKWSPYNTWDRLFYRPFTYLGSHGMNREYGTRKSYLQMGQSHRLELADIVYFDFSLVPPPLDNKVISFANSIADYLESQGRGPLRVLGNGFLVKFEAI